MRKIYTPMHDIVLFDGDARKGTVINFSNAITQSGHLVDDFEGFLFEAWGWSYGYKNGSLYISMAHILDMIDNKDGAYSGQENWIIDYRSNNTMLNQFDVTIKVWDNPAEWTVDSYGTGNTADTIGGVRKITGILKK